VNDGAAKDTLAASDGIKKIGSASTRRRRNAGGRTSSALRLQARIVGANEGANVVGHVEELRPLLLVEGDGEAPEAVDRTPPFSLTLRLTPRLAVRLSRSFSARKRSSSFVTSSSDMRGP
jgi:hypothetical protein